MAVNSFSGLPAIPASYGFTAGKNKIINGDFRINQRGFTSLTTTGSYTFDRFVSATSGGTVTYSAQTFTPGTAPVAGYEGINFLRIVSTSQSTSNDYAGIVQRIEDVRTFANQTVTVSFWAKASTGTPNVGISMYQDFGSGGSAAVTTSPAVQAITSSWARYSFIVTVPSVSGKTIGANSYIAPHLFTSVGTSISAAGFAAVGLQNVTIDFWGIQVEAGSTATAFQTATGTLAGELAACQRYYIRLGGNSAYETVGVSYNVSTTAMKAIIALPVMMRTKPSSMESSLLCIQDTNDALSATLTNLTLADEGRQQIRIAGTGSGLNDNSVGTLLTNNSTSGYIAFNAEL